MLNNIEQTPKKISSNKKHHVLLSLEQKEMLENVTNIINTFQMYQTFQDEITKINQDEDSPLPKIDNLDALKGMLTPEQQNMFDTYSALFNNS